MATVAELFASALRYHQSGALQQAAQLYNQILQLEPNHADALHLLGVYEYQMGRFDQAVALIRHAIALNPTIATYHCNLGQTHMALMEIDEAVARFQLALRLQPRLREALYNLGIAYLQLGKLDQAVNHFQRTLEVSPQYPEAHGNLAAALAGQGNADQAVAHFREALRLNPNYVEAHKNLADTLLAQGKLDEAMPHWQEAVRIRPDYADAHCNWGIGLLYRKCLDEAACQFREALRLSPTLAEAHNGLGNVLEEQNNLDEAVRHYRLAVQLRPQLPDAWNNLGNALSKQDNFPEAVSCFEQALRLKPNYPQAHYNLGNVLAKQNKLDDAVRFFHQALALKPDYAEACNNLGSVLARQDKLDKGLAGVEQALRLNPDFPMAHWNRAVMWLLRGDFERGWPEYEWRWAQNEYDRRQVTQPLWDGSPLAGRTILLYAEQGLGDTLQFIRYVPLVKERGGKVIVQCQPALVRLLANAPGIDHLIAQNAAAPAFDVHAPLLSLPGIFHTSLQCAPRADGGQSATAVPATVPYLHANSDLVAKWHGKLKGLSGFKIGIAWQGNPTFRDDRQRSIPLARFAPLAQVEGVSLISLQKGPGEDQLRGLAGTFPVHDLGKEFDEASGPFMDTAAVMMNLDLVISTDTVIPHLAGALGVPVWVPLALVPDWRWMLRREDSPWYPTMRLFRQTRGGDWDDVFERIVKELKQLIKPPGA